LILTFILTSCQNEKKLNGTWISAYHFNKNDTIRESIVGDFPFNQIITFENGTFEINEFKRDNYENFRTENFKLKGNRLVISDHDEHLSEIIEPLTNDSIVISQLVGVQKRVYKRLSDSLKNKTPEFKLTGKKFVRNYRKWTDTIHFVNDSVYLSSSWQFGNSNRFMWERMTHKGFDILFTENYSPFILKNKIGNKIYISTFGSRKENYILTEIK